MSGGYHSRVCFHILGIKKAVSVEKLFQIQILNNARKRAPFVYHEKHKTTEAERGEISWLMLQFLDYALENVAEYLG